MATETIDVVTGGVRCIVEQLNHLVVMGHNVCCFTQWGSSPAFEAHFPLYPMSHLYGFDGIVICPWSECAEYVAQGPQEEKFYYVHAYEPLFPRDQEWRDTSYRSYSLPMKIFTTSSYLHILMETNHQRRVIGQLVPGGVNTELFCPGEKSDDQIHIGILNRPDVFRGRNDVLQAMIPIKKKYKDRVKLILFGNDPKPNCPKVPYEYSYAFTPTQQLLAKLYGSLHIFINPSWREGFPLPPMEAAACGAAVITTTWGTTNAWLDGFNCLTAPSRSPWVLTEKIDFLIQNENALHGISEMGKRTAANYTWAASAMRLEAAIKEGLGKNEYLKPVDMGFPPEPKKEGNNGEKTS